LENLLKGLLVAQGVDATSTGKLNNELKTHNLVHLWKLAGLPLTNQEEEILKILQWAIETNKYPVGLRHDAITPNGFNVANTTANVHRIVALIETVENALRETPSEAFEKIDLLKICTESTDAGTSTSIAYSLAPMLSVRNGARAVEFYKSAFGAIEVYRMEDPGGSVVARLAIDGAEFWLADESPEHQNFSPESLGGGTTRMILTVPDPDAIFARAVAAGAREVVAVKEEYGWRLGRVVDPFGHYWEIGHPLAS
jgi:PhnB protein